MVHRDARELAEWCGLHDIRFVVHSRRERGYLQYRQHRLEPTGCTCRQGENCYEDQLGISHADSHW